MSADNGNALKSQGRLDKGNQFEYTKNLYPVIWHWLKYQKTYRSFRIYLEELKEVARAFKNGGNNG
jgi:hypothetical protein